MANEEGDISPIANNPNNAHNVPNPFDFPYPEERIRVENAIKRTIRDNGVLKDDIDRNFKLLQTFLKDTGSVIAGGALLSWFHGDILQDIDIYVNVKHLEAARTTLARVFNVTKPSSYISPSIYCKTHMKENGIQKIYTLRHYVTRFNKIDIMAIRNKKNITDVVQNFDFTFCQIWYDGEDLHATHPQDVRNKNGTLRGIYNKEFIDKFIFIRKRCKKYLRKGYTIDFDNDELEKYIPTKSYNRLCGEAAKNDPDYYDTWFGHTMLKCLFGNDYYPVNTSNRHMQIPVILYPTESDGYDSEEFPTLDKFFDIKPEENVYSTYMKLKKDYITPHLDYTFSSEHNLDSGLLKHYQAIVDRSKKNGTCILTKEENIDVYYLHQHDVDTEHENSYISPAGLQKYLDANKDDRMGVECFFSGCDKKITPDEVLFIVSNEWYKEYYKQ